MGTQEAGQKFEEKRKNVSIRQLKTVQRIWMVFPHSMFSHSKCWHL